MHKISHNNIPEKIIFVQMYAIQTLIFRIIVLLLCLPVLSKAQAIKIDSAIADNKITFYKNQKLILIDFWATWCGPCVPATIQLEIMQESTADMVYMVSMSDEKNKTIVDYLRKKPIRLAVLSDYNRHNIKLYDISSRPYCVLLDYNGKVLWKGAPSDLKVKDIERYHASVKGNNTKNLSQIFEIAPRANPHSSLKIEDPMVSIPNSLVQYTTQCPTESPSMGYSYCGKLGDFILERLDIANIQLDDAPYNNKNILISTPPSHLYNIENSEYVDTVLKYLELKVSQEIRPKRLTEIYVKHPDMLWDTAQIQWEMGSPKFLVGTSRLQANNARIKEVADALNKLASMRNYFYAGRDQNLYDWDFTYEVDNLMKEELEFGFGIKLIDRELKLPIYKLEPIRP